MARLRGRVLSRGVSCVEQEGHRCTVCPVGCAQAVEPACVASFLESVAQAFSFRGGRSCALREEETQLGPGEQDVGGLGDGGGGGRHAPCGEPRGLGGFLQCDACSLCPARSFLALREGTKEPSRLGGLGFEEVFRGGSFASQPGDGAVAAGHPLPDVRGGQQILADSGLVGSEGPLSGFLGTLPSSLLGGGWTASGDTRDAGSRGWCLTEALRQVLLSCAGCFESSVQPHEQSFEALA